MTSLISQTHKSIEFVVVYETSLVVLGGRGAENGEILVKGYTDSDI